MLANTAIYPASQGSNKQAAPSPEISSLMPAPKASTSKASTSKASTSKASTSKASTSKASASQASTSQASAPKPIAQGGKKRKIVELSSADIDSNKPKQSKTAAAKKQSINDGSDGDDGADAALKKWKQLQRSFSMTTSSQAVASDSNNSVSQSLSSSQEGNGTYLTEAKGRKMIKASEDALKAAIQNRFTTLSDLWNANNENCNAKFAELKALILSQQPPAAASQDKSSADKPFNPKDYEKLFHDKPRDLDEIFENIKFPLHRAADMMIFNAALPLTGETDLVKELVNFLNFF
jgi:hypothetical protein